MKRRRTSLTSSVLTEHPIESSPSSGLHPKFGFSIIVFPKFIILDEIFLDDELGESFHDLRLPISSSLLSCLRRGTYLGRPLVTSMTSIYLPPILPDFGRNPRSTLYPREEPPKTPDHSLTSSEHGRDIPLHLVWVDRGAILIFPQPTLMDC
jgi:hypothetical protein